VLSADRWRRGDLWFAQPGSVLARVLGGRCAGRGRVYMERVGMDEGVGYQPNQRGGRWRFSRGARRVRPSLSGRDDMWGPPVSGRRLKTIPVREERGDGPLAISGSRPKLCRRPLFPFLILFPFLF
jgi:hypothetical protein